MPETEGKLPISGCVVAKDEEDRIEACVASLDFCDEVLVVVDAASSDRTLELAQASGARVLVRTWDGFGVQKNRASDAAKHDWILSLDADERVSADLRAQILAQGMEGLERHPGWEFSRLSHYMGAWIRHGTWFPDRQLRLFDRRRGRFTEDRNPHDHVALEGSVGRLGGWLEHHPYRDLSEHLRTIDRYTTVAAERLLSQGRAVGPLDVLLRPVGGFLRFYLLKRGFLLGWRGVFLAGTTAYYVQLKYAKVLWMRAEGRKGAADPSPE